jgi:hypothetical protein
MSSPQHVYGELQVMPSWLQGALTRAPSAAHVTGGPPVVLLELAVEVAVELELEVEVELPPIPPLALDADVDVEVVVDPDVVPVVDVLPEAPPEPVAPVCPTPALPPQAERRTIERKRIRMPASYHEPRKCRVR